MKKKMMIGLMLWLSAMGAMAQEEVENPVGKFSVVPRIGVAIANMTDNSQAVHSDQLGSLKSKSQAGFVGGVDVEYRATEYLGVSLGAYYARQGFRYADYEAVDENNADNRTGYHDQHANLNYVNVPLLLKGYITRNFAVMAGVQAGFLCGDAKFHSEATDLVKDKDGSTIYKETTKEETILPSKKVDFSIPVGLSYEYMNVVLDARYNIGLTKALDGESRNCKNKAFVFTVGYRFTL